MSSIDDSLVSIMKALLVLDDEMSSFISSSETAENVANALVRLHEVKSAISDIYSVHSGRAIEILQSQGVEDIDVHGARVEVRNSADRRKWNHQELAKEVTGRLVDMSIDMDTGEVLLSPQEIAIKILDFVQPSYWRVKDLAKVGINADQFCEVGEYKSSVIIRKAK